MKFSTLNTAILVILPILTAGCSSVYEPKPDIQSIKAESLITSTASLKSEYVHRRGSGLIMCTPPPPDATFSQGKDSGTNISVLNFGSDKDDAGGSEDEEKSSGEQMAGRAPHVLLERDLLFRLCEFVRNNNVDQATAIKLYEKNLDIIAASASIAAERTTITVSNTIADKNRNSNGSRMHLPDNTGSLNSATPSYSGQATPGAIPYQSYGGTGAYQGYQGYQGTGSYYGSGTINGQPVQSGGAINGQPVQGGGSINGVPVQ